MILDGRPPVSSVPCSRSPLLVVPDVEQATNHVRSLDWCEVGDVDVELVAANLRPAASGSPAAQPQQPEVHGRHDRLRISRFQVHSRSRNLYVWLLTDVLRTDEDEIRP